MTMFVKLANEPDAYINLARVAKAVRRKNYMDLYEHGEDDPLGFCLFEDWQKVVSQ